MSKCVSGDFPMLVVVLTSRRRARGREWNLDTRKGCRLFPFVDPALSVDPQLFRGAL
jgi:hypothetical protein